MNYQFSWDRSSLGIRNLFDPYYQTMWSRHLQVPTRFAVFRTYSMIEGEKGYLMYFIFLFFC